MTLSIHNLPRVLINFLPTPLVELGRLADVLDGPRILMKRDDLTGLGLGGNKKCVILAYWRYTGTF